MEAPVSTLVGHAWRIWAGLDLGGAKNRFVDCAGGRRIVVGCVLVEFGNVAGGNDFGFGRCGTDDGPRAWGLDIRDARDVCDADDPSDVGGEWGRERRAVDDVLPRRGAEWSGT